MGHAENDSFAADARVFEVFEAAPSRKERVDALWARGCAKKIVGHHPTEMADIVGAQRVEVRAVAPRNVSEIGAGGLARGRVAGIPDASEVFRDAMRESAWKKG